MLERATTENHTNHYLSHFFSRITAFAFLGGSVVLFSRRSFILRRGFGEILSKIGTDEHDMIFIL